MAPTMRYTRPSASIGRSLLIVLMAALVLVNLSPASIAAAASDDRYKVASGIAVYLGLLPAEQIKGHPKNHPESSMHDGSSKGAHDYHVVAAVFDDKTGARIEDATVRAHVAPLGLAAQDVALEPMKIAGTVTYGGYLKLPEDLYTIRISVNRPGVAQPVALDFKFDHRRTSPRQ